jgi:hypothetical protein
VLAAQQDCGLARETTKDNVCGVNDMPLAVDIAGLRGVRTHGVCLVLVLAFLF